MAKETTATAANADAATAPEVDRDAQKRQDRISRFCDEFASNDSQRNAIQKAFKEGVAPEALAEQFLPSGVRSPRRNCFLKRVKDVIG